MATLTLFPGNERSVAGERWEVCRGRSLHQYEVASQSGGVFCCKGRMAVPPIAIPGVCTLTSFLLLAANIKKLPLHSDRRP